MCLYFQILTKDKDEQNLIDNFLSFLVYSIRYEILDKAQQKLDLLEQKNQDIKKASWIKWKNSKKELDAYKLVEQIAKNIVYMRLDDNKCLITINPGKIVSGTSNRLEQFARFIDKGNDISIKIPIITKVFIWYQHNIQDVWKSFIAKELRRFTLSKITLLR